MKKIFTLLVPQLILSVFVFSISFAQQGRINMIGCATDEVMKEYYNANPEAKKQFDEFNVVTKQLTKKYEEMRNKGDLTRFKSPTAAKYIIPVVFHILHQNGPERINAAQCQSALDIANEDFNGLNSDWNSIDANFDGIKDVVDIEFCLATKDQFGNATDGTSYHEDGACGRSAAELTKYAWDNKMYMEVYVVRDVECNGTNTNSGYAYYPDNGMTNANTARIVYNHRYLGSIGTGDGSHQNREFMSVFTHECGHWLNLPHTFDNGCNAPGDLVDDTPPDNTAGGPCSPNTSCSSPENHENYMDYTSCTKMFTKGQCDRMRAALDSHTARSVLWQPDNLAATGCSPVTATSPPAAAFSWTPANPSYNTPISFTDESLTIDPITSWSWTFEGATPATSTDQNPTNVQWPTGGTFEVTLTVTNSFGSNTATRMITIVGPLPPEPDFTVNGFTNAAQADIVINTPVTILSTTTTNSPISVWSWTMTGADVTSSNTETVPVLTYTTPGTYDIVLTVTNDASTETITKTITVRLPYPPVASFTANPVTLNEGGSVTFTDASASETPITSWVWDFPGASSITTYTGETPPPIVYDTPGSYTVTLTVTNEGGTDTQTITGIITVDKVWQIPVADFQATTATTIDENQTVTFEDLSTGEVVNWSWTFEGGFPSTYTTDGSPPAITYQTAGVYEVTLTVSNPGGSDTETKTAYITVNASGPPVADFTANGNSSSNFLTVSLGGTVNFLDASTPSSSITSWDWFLPGSDFIGASQQFVQNPSVTYMAEGTFPVRLTVTNANGSDETNIVGYITVVNSVLPPVAGFNPSTVVIDEGQSITFTDQTNNNGTVVTYDWTFNGGIPNSSTSAGPHTITYNTAGTYDAILTVTNANGTDTKTVQITVNSVSTGNSPTANFTVSATTINEGQTITFTDASLDNGDAITSWNWTFNGGSPASSSSQTPGAVTFNTTGTYDVVLSVTNANGTNTKTVQITVDPGSGGNPPTADIAFSATTINVGQSITFTDASLDNGDAITAWSWTFGGGTPVSASTIGPHTITFNTAGTYDITLSVTNANGTDTKTISIAIAELPPVADFSISNGATIEQGGTLTFTDISTGANITGWSWVFENGAPATALTQDPGTVTFNVVGTWDVTLAVTNAGGTNEITKTVTVTVPGALTAVIDMTPSTTLLPFGNKLLTGESIDFDDASISQLAITDWTWDFDGATPATSAVQNPGVVIFNTAGTYTISLTVDNGSETDTRTETIVVIDPLVPDFSGTPTSVTVGESVDFTNLSTSPSTISSWSWTFTGADVVNSTQQNPTGITYSIPGTYAVTLVVTNADQTATVVKTDYITVGDNIVVTADFFANKTTIKVGESVNYTDASTTTGTAINSWNWSFEGGTPTTSTAQNPNGISYNTVGTYKVTLTVSSPDGSDTEEKVTYIIVNDLSLPEADFEVVAGKQIIGTGMCVNFADLTTSSLPIIQWAWEFEGGTPATSNAINPIDITYSSAGTYKVKLTVTNTDGSAFDEKIGYITVEEGNPNPYCTAHRIDDCKCEFEYISNVSLTEVGGPTHIDNTTNCGNYSLYSTAASGNLMTLKEYEVKVDVGNATNATPFITAYLDWNDNKQFDGGNEEVALIFNTTTGIATRKFKIPEDAKVNVDIRMRVRLQFFGPGDACGDTDYGEIEDYTFKTDYNPATGYPTIIEELFNVNVFPNPNNGLFTISVTSERSESIEIELHDVSGKLIKTDNMYTVSGKVNKQMNLGDVAEGVYSLRMIAGSKVVNKRLIINK